MTDAPQFPSPQKRALIIVTVMAATLMQALDGTIANVALPHMQAALGATPESIAWVLTSYIITSAIATPISGWLESHFGRRRVLIIAITVFTASSALCGGAKSLELMVVARAIQGIFGAFIIPLGIATLVDSSPPEKRAQAMTIWISGVMVGPIFGPVIGGWIVDTMDWRWIFFINIPVGAVAVLGCWLLIAEPKVEKRPFDLFGFALLAIALSAFQLMLDRGPHLDWFESREILVETAIAIAAAWVFVIHSSTARNPLIPIAVFRDRNLVTSTFFIFVTSGVVYGGAALVAPMLQHLMGYDTMTAGMVMLPRGAATLVGMLMAGRLIKIVQARFVVAAGMLLTAFGLLIMTEFNLQMAGGPIIWSGILQGIGVGLVFMPLQLMAFDTLAPSLRTEGASLFSISRSLGSSICISVLSALLARNIQVSHADIGGRLTAVSAPYLDPGLSHAFGQSGNVIAAMVDAEINRQAMMIAYLDDYWLMMWAVFIALPMVLLLHKSAGRVPKSDGETPAILYE